MKKIIKILVILVLICAPLFVSAAAININITTWWPTNQFDNLNSWNIKNAWTQDGKNTHLRDLKNPSTDRFIGSLKKWEGGIKYLLIRAAKDLKTVFYILGWLYILIMVLRLLFMDNTEEEIGKFKKWVTWVTMWIILMQIVYSFITILYDKAIWENLWYNLIDKLINPLISLLETATSFFFLAIAIYAFFRIITADWDEEKIKTWKKSTIYAIVWFVVIKFARKLVEVTYWTLNPACHNSFWFNFISWSCLQDARISWFSSLVATIINWVNSFIWIIMLIMIMYAWSLVLLSAWDEEKLKKAKSIILYVIIWVTILVFNYLILTFFIIPEKII